MRRFQYEKLMREWFFIKMKLRGFRYVLLDFHKGAVHVESDLAYLIPCYLEDLRILSNSVNFFKPHIKEGAIRCKAFLQEIWRRVRAMEKIVDSVFDHFI